MGVKKHISETPLSKSNSVDLYRPPALRKNSSEEAASESTNDQQPKATATAASSNTAATATAAGTSTTSKSSPNREQLAAAAATRRERRPDRAVYVPRARRSQTTPPTTTTVAAATTTATATTVETATVVDITSPKADDTTNSNNSNGHQAGIKSKKSSKRREQRVKKIIEKPWEDPEASATLLVIDKQPTSALRETETQLNQGGAGDDESIGNCDKDKEIMSGNQQHKMANKNGTKQLLSTALRIEDASSNSSASAEDATKCDNDVQELQRASKEINRSNRRIMKQTFISDVLEIPDKIEIKPKAQKVAAALPQPQQQPPPPADSTTEDDEEDEDDWENMFDESGDCLDPKILQELTDSVGKCKIELPKMDYTVYHIKQSLLNEEEFPHVLEVSNFPVEFKTPDLLMLFSQYKGTGFDIKWVDDTHALAVFSSSRIAAEVLTMGHPFVKLKPLAEATLESRLKAKKAATSLQPYRQRPETCTALARRLVSGALGVKLPTAPEERENERRVLREAKERKLLAAKQRDEAWES
ncbi:uncharacterized protein Dwil_GK16578 [Drosophila willistoni]|uniref:R3H domain-containing protein n=1 Tax=Drosophila willistoni TaxID=7260 RepID=B4MN17_DROWI|nr:coiled-coil domain-containing protein R3HCC1L [Drosophila willistoni]EDW73573.1 uncharacterized protein Dwil_GK16578 [Drosophila willistoni]